MAKSTILIYYCPKCGWLLRSAYFAQEILTSFSEDLEAVTLKPSVTAGQFSIFVNEEMLFDRKRDGGFPEIKILKQRIRDIVDPNKSLGHSDRS